MNRDVRYDFALTETGFLRLKQIIGAPHTDTLTPALMPVSKSTWWEGGKIGRFPKAIKLGPRTTVWRVEDIREFINDPKWYMKSSL